MCESWRFGAQMRTAGSAQVQDQGPGPYRNFRVCKMLVQYGGRHAALRSKSQIDGE